MSLLEQNALSYKDGLKLIGEISKKTALFADPFFLYEKNKIFNPLPKNSIIQTMPFTKEKFEEAKYFLEKKGLYFEEYNSDVRTCCDVSTNNLQHIVFPFERTPGNVLVQNPIFSENPVWGIYFKAYMVGFGPQEEKLQKLLVEKDIEMGTWPQSNSSSSFSIYKSKEEAQKYLAQENKDYIDEHGNLKDGLILIGGLTKVRNVHSDGTAIVCSDDHRSLPLEDEFNSSKGFMFDTGLASVNYHYIHRLTTCSHCEEEKTSELKEKVISAVESYGNNGWGFDLKPHKSYGSDYIPNTKNIRLHLESRMNSFE